MKQRELQDRDGTRWVLAQALAGVEGEAADQAAAQQAEHSAVTVVATPSGGERSRRLALAPD